MITQHKEYEIDDRPQRLDIGRIHGWLEKSYWSPGVSRAVVERAFANSALVVGAYHGEEQVGCLRAVSDKATFAWVADVFVDEAHRRRGIALAMVRFALEHPEFQGLRRWMLGTRDMHAVYAAAGFRQVDRPEPLMWFTPRKAVPTG